MQKCREWLREMKVGAFVKRERGDGSTPEECGTRELPKPTAVSAFAAIEADGSVLASVESEQNCRHLLATLRRPVENILENPA